MDALERIQRLETAIGERIQALLGEIAGLIHEHGMTAGRLEAAKRDVERLTALLAQQDDLRRQKESEVEALRRVVRASRDRHSVPAASSTADTFSPAVQKVVDFVWKEGRAVTPKEVRDALGFDSVPNARQALWRAKQTGRIESRGRGLYGPAQKQAPGTVMGSVGTGISGPPEASDGVPLTS